MTDITTILNACELVWRQQSVSQDLIHDMRGELESHLLEAQREGKEPESVIGPNLDAFARAWSSPDSQPSREVPASFAAAQEHRTVEANQARTRLFIAMGAIALVTILGLALGPKSDFEAIEVWQWTFVIATFTLLIGEIYTGGFFVLPFGIGAASTSLLALAKVEPPVLILVFIVTSILGLWGLRELASKDDDHIVPVGANRYVDQTAVVTQAINGIGTVGRVRLETESWMAISDGNVHIPAGQVVRVSEVRGARLVVSGV